MRAEDGASVAALTVGVYSLSLLVVLSQNLITVILVLALQRPCFGCYLYSEGFEGNIKDGSGSILRMISSIPKLQ